MKYAISCQAALFAAVLLFFAPHTYAIVELMKSTAATVVDTADNSKEKKEAIPDLLGDDDWSEEDWQDEEEGAAEELSAERETIHDPFEPANRIFFSFNNHLYDWVLKPATEGYSWLLPIEVRESIGNLFTNIGAPVRLVNTTLQGDMEKSTIIIERFLINSTLGAFGLHDVADENFHIKGQKADFGQTLGVWGVGFGPYLCWPLLGPSSVRDSVGLGIDSYLNPTGYIIDDWEMQLGYTGLKMTNTLSLHPGLVEDLRRVSLDPYVAARQAYFDYRSNMITRKHPAEEKQVVESGEEQEYVVETPE